jgi:hypothetical protein
VFEDYKKILNFFIAFSAVCIALSLFNVFFCIISYAPILFGITSLVLLLFSILKLKTDKSILVRLLILIVLGLIHFSVLYIKLDRFVNL